MFVSSPLDWTLKVIIPTPGLCLFNDDKNEANIQP